MTNVENFLNTWDQRYKNKMQNIDLFNVDKTKLLNKEQKSYFAKIFYHARGHFHNFLWYLGNHATDKETKDIVLKNISEELNGSAKSHEQMYFDFANALEADIKKESIEQSNYLPFIKDFNEGHLRWLDKHDEEERFSAFSAYERLDNVDYIYLEKLVESFDIPKKFKLFFTVHVRVEHFETTESKLNNLWNSNFEKVQNGFDFIANHQINMWNQLSNSVFNYKH